MLCYIIQIDKKHLYRASPSEFVIPLAKYQKAVYGNQVSLGMRFRMMFETEESGTRRCGFDSSPILTNQTEAIILLNLFSICAALTMCNHNLFYKV